MLTQYTRIIAAVDGSEDASRGAAVAASLAKAMNCPLTLLCVFPGPGADEFVNLDSVSVSLRLTPEDMEGAKHEASSKAFAAARKAIGDSQVKIEEQVVSGRVVPEILRVAEASKPALLVVGRRGLGHFGEMMLGSVSDKLVHQASVPVVVV
jgi:nucleotide-binding universal stress UspA family protein